jgi:hypothetical protein
MRRRRFLMMASSSLSDSLSMKEVSPSSSSAALVDEKGRVAAVVDDELWTLAVGPGEGGFSAIPVFLEGLSLPGENRNSGSGDRRGGVVLGREDVAGLHQRTSAPSSNEGLDEDGGLDRHVQRSHDTNALEWLGGSIFCPCRHEAGHLVLGDLDLEASESGEADVGHFVIFWYRY